MPTTRPPKRLYVSTPLAGPGQSVPLPDALQHRLRSVLRQPQGATLHLFNGTQGLWEATLADAKARTATLTRQLTGQTTLPPLTLLIGMPKKDAWETVLRQATELGVTTIIPLKTEFAQVDKLTNPERAQTIMAEAAEQSERLCLPTLRPVTPLASLREAYEGEILWCAERKGNQGIAQKCHALLVGPEGGFSPQEVDILSKTSGIFAQSLGPTILKTDTATVAGLSLIINSNSAT